MTRGTVPTARFGTTGMEITRVGFGAWAIGGGGWEYAWGSQDDAVAVKAIQRAVDAGVNWIDTAAVYGLGHSEEVVGRALRGISDADRPYVFTKCGRVWDDSGKLKSVASSRSIRGELEASLRRLGVERIDLYQVHRPPEDGTSLDEYWGTMLELVAEGKIRAAGLSNHSVQQMAGAEQIGHVDSLQPPLSIIDRSAAAELIPWCHDHGTGVIVYSPLQSGLLTGKYGAAEVAALPEDDWRRTAPDFTTKLAANLVVVDSVREVAAKHGVTPSAVAVAWTLAWPGVTGAIVGARSPDQIDAWINSADVALTTEDFDSIADAIRSGGVGDGPPSPRR